MSHTQTNYYDSILTVHINTDKCRGRAITVLSYTAVHSSVTKKEGVNGQRGESDRSVSHTSDGGSICMWEVGGAGGGALIYSYQRGREITNH